MVVVYAQTSYGDVLHMRMRSVCVTYAVYNYVTFRTFDVINLFAAVQRLRKVNLII